MTETIVTNETFIRLACFLSVFTVIALWEIGLPRRKRVVSRWVRWPSNLGIVVLNTLLVRILIPTAAVGFALIVEVQNWGLLNQLAAPGWVTIVLAILILDFSIYLQHIMFHAVPLFWRMHRMHHADLDFDVTTGARFHPVEILLSMGIKLMVVAALGPPVAAVVIFEVLLNATSMFNHGNVRMPLGLDRVLRWLVVTPDMHRVHHSILPNETNSNFGFNLPWWDRLFGTYRAQPVAGHDEMTIGIEEFSEPRELRLDRMLAQPFRGAVGRYPITRDGPYD
ncbi:MAG: sterol desaturase family protein [Gammaproteobacteria bacterium]|nr:sterol desaturase family protein [Gammaproteobacteria bacterium]